MNKQQLREQLDELSEAINGLEASSADKKRLDALVADIELQLSQPLLESEQQSLADQVEGMMTSFEQEHPAVAGILNNLMITLGSMGI